MFERILAVETRKYIEQGFLLLSLVVGGAIGIVVVTHLVLYFVGGVELITDVWSHKEADNYHWVVFVAIFLGGIPAMVLGVGIGIRLIRVAN